MGKIYTSFSALDKDIKIAQLEKDIEVELLKSKYYKLKEKSSPANVALSFARKMNEFLYQYRGSIVKFAALYLIKRFVRKKK